MRSDKGKNIATLVDLVRQRVDGAASQSAYVFLLDGETERSEITYGELDRQARTIAAWLQSHRAQGERAILLYPPDLDYITAFFGCLYAGVVAVPAYPPQRQRTLGRLQTILTDSGATFALTTTRMHASIERLSRQDSGIDRFRNVQWLETDTLPKGSESTWQMPAVTAQTLAFLQYTSGSTGSPKGVMVSHANLLHNQRMIQASFGHGEDTIVLGWLPLYHDMGLIGNVLQPLYLGRPCVLMSPVHFIQKPFRWLSAISRYRATTSGAPNFAYDLCVRQISVEERDQLDLSAWSVAFNGAEPIHAGTLDRFSERFAPCGFKKTAFYPCYGLAEATLFVAGGEHGMLPVVRKVEKTELERGRLIDSPQADSSAQRLVACGRTSLDQEVVIVNPETLSHCPEGEVGEIWMKGPSVAQGYWGSPEAMAATFSAQAVDTGEGPFLRTGDLGVIQNEELFVVGRLKDLIIIRGRNHYPHDIEATVQESHPSLRPGCGAAFSIQADEEERLVVVQEIKQRAQFNLHEVAAAVRHAVAEQHDVEVYAVVLIKVGSLPKTSSGKIQRNTCRNKFLARSLDVIEESMQDPGTGQATFTKPCSPTEQAIADIWAQVLGREPIGRDDHFFALGGDSLRAAQVVARLNQAFHIELTLDCLFEKLTVAELAKHIAECQQTDSTCIPLHISPRGGGESEPLSFAEQRLWFLDHISAGVPLNNIPVALRLEGPLDIRAFEQGLSEIVRRHETLRTTFILRDGLPVKVIAPPAPVELPVIDLCHVAPSEREMEVSRLVQEEGRRPFDLTQSPLLRACLLRLRETGHVFMLTVHHIIADDWSMGVLSRELSVLYDAFRRGEPSPLPELPIQYIDVARHQRQRLQQGDRLAALLSYWRAQLAGSPPFQNLPTDHPRPSVPTYQGTCQTFALSKPLTEALKTLSQQEGVTLFMILLAAFHTLLFRYTGQDDIKIGCTIANREQVEAEPLIGFFVNLLVFRARLEGNLSFRDLLRKVRETAVGGYAHQALPFEMLVEELQPERRMSQTPLFQVLFVLQNTPPTLALHGISVTSLETHSQTSQFDLTLSMLEEADGLVGAIEYSTDLFEAATIERLINHYRRLLEAIVVEPTTRVSELAMLSPVERTQLLEEWNATVADYSATQTIPELFEAQVVQTPEAVAVAYEDEQLTYGELNARANRLAAYLRRSGVGPESRVVLFVERSPTMVLAAIAVMKAGGAYVPLDPTYPAERLRYMLADCQPAVVLTQTHLQGALPATALPTLCLDSQWATVATYKADNLVHHIRPQHLAYVIYTSGSSGVPKGVMITHRSLVNVYFAWEAEYRLRTDCRNHLQMASFSFDVCSGDFIRSLCSGGKLVICPHARLLSPADLHSFMVQEAIDCAEFTPMVLRGLVRYLEATGQHLNFMQVLAVGSDTWSGDEYTAAVKVCRPEARMIHSYGITETTIDSTYFERGKRSEVGSGTLPIGRPFPNTNIYILDEILTPVPVGVVGELHIAGAGLARGYLGRPALTAERFIPNPFSQEPGARMYKSGDLTRYHPDGNIEYLGRIDQQVKIRGFRIELGEIEAVLKQHPAVRAAVVVAREDQPGDKRLVAYVLAEPDASLEGSRLRQHLARVLPEYMVPSAFVLLAQFPLTPNGKLDRKALPAPEQTRGEEGYVAPRTVVEAQVAAIWAAVLKLDRVGVEDNFFELGGHSLVAITVLERLRQVGLSADVRTLFTAPTVAALAAAVGTTREIAVPPNRIPADCDHLTPYMLSLIQLTSEELARIEQAVPGGARNIQDLYPLAPLQEGILFHHLLQQRGDVYLLPTLLSFDTRERLDKFLAALQRVIERHDILRTAIVWEGLAEPVQVVWREAPLAIDEITLEGDAGEAAAQLQARVDPRHYRLDVRQAPMLRGFVTADPAHERWLLQVVFHHLISDHTTDELVLDEVQAHLQGQAAQLPSSVPFRNFVAQARLGVPRAEHEAFFRDMLGEVTEPTLPFGLREVQGEGAANEEASRPVDLHLARRLRQQARRLGVSAASLLHVAWAQVLARVSGRQDVVFGTVLFGRMAGGQGADRVPGLFINTLPIRIDVGQGGVAACVRDTHTLLTRLLEHEHASLALAQRCSGIAAPQPLFSALFNYRHSPQLNADDATPLPAWEGIMVLSAEERTNYPMGMSVDDFGEGFRLTADVSAPIQAQRICAYLHTVLEQLVEALETAPETPVYQLEVLSAAERQQLLVEWNATVAAYPATQTIPELFETQVEKTPETEAVVYEDARLTYGELNARANQLARYLRQVGVGPDVLVGLCVERSLEMIVGLLGILKAGGAYVPLDPTYPTERLAYMLADSQPGVLLTQAHLHADLPATELPTLCLDSQWATVATYPSTNLVHHIHPDHLAYVIYTSGSTGKPKGVGISHCALANHSTAIVKHYGLRATDRVLQFTSISFDVAAEECLPTWAAGATVVLRPNEPVPEFSDFQQFIEDHRLTVLNLPTPYWAEWIDALEHSGTALPLSIRQVIVGSEKALPESLVRWQRLAGDRIAWCNAYGPTEATITASYFVPERQEDWISVSTVPIGQPIANVELYILDQALQPVPIGVAGELYIAGKGLARGYHHQPAWTAEKFIPHCFSHEPGCRLYRTGDRVRRRVDGNVEFLGRYDDQMKIRGFRVEPAEIEFWTKQHPAVKDVRVFLEASVQSDRQAIMGSLTDEEQDSVLKEIESLTAVEAQWLYDFETDAEARRKTVIQRRSEFDCYLKINKEGFLNPPRQNQRNWLLHRALDEFSDDLIQLDGIAKRFVSGSDRVDIEGIWAESHAKYKPTELIIDGQQVMQDWEKPLMKAMADIATESGGHVLEVGFGMGISASFIQERHPKSHTIIEFNQEVIAAFSQWRSQYHDRDIQLVRGRWQDVAETLPQFDSVFFDAYPTSEAEFQELVINSITFAESFIPVAAKLLRPGGVLTYYSNEIDSFSRRHQRFLFKHFHSFTLSVVGSLRPPEDCHYWWADSMVAVKAVK